MNALSCHMLWVDGVGFLVVEFYLSLSPQMPIFQRLQLSGNYILPQSNQTADNISLGMSCMVFQYFLISLVSLECDMQKNLPTMIHSPITSFISRTSNNTFVFISAKHSSIGIISFLILNGPKIPFY